VVIWRPFFFRALKEAPRLSPRHCRFSFFAFPGAFLAKGIHRPSLTYCSLPVPRFFCDYSVLSYFPGGINNFFFFFAPPNIPFVPDFFFFFFLPGSDGRSVQGHAGFKRGCVVIRDILIWTGARFPFATLVSVLAFREPEG